MEITTTTTDRTPRRQAAVNALAVVGFIALIIIGIVLAIYSARFIPVAFDRMGSASAISSLFKPSDDEPELDVISTGDEISFQPVATSTDSDNDDDDSDSSDTRKPATNTGTKTPVAGPTRTVRVPVTTPAPAPYGKADLTVDITAVGYCSSDRPSSFRESRDITDDRNGGVQFRVKNIGTNVSGRWDFTYNVPTSATQRAETDQRSLNPGDAIEYTLCYEKPKAGDNRTITVKVDTGRDVNESNENNNSDSVEVDIDR
jgi:hypothetical protein